MVTRLGGLAGAVLLVSWLATPDPVQATYIRITISGAANAGSTYTYAYAKVGTASQTASNASNTGADISSSASKSASGKSATSLSQISSSGSSTNLTVSTTASGSSTSASGFAQKGMTYASASEVQFDVIIEDLWVSGVANGDNPSWLEFHLNDLPSDQIDPLAPDPEDALAQGFYSIGSPTNFFFLRVLTDPTEMQLFDVLNMLGPNTRLIQATMTQNGEELVVDRLLGEGDFYHYWMPSDHNSWILRNTPWTFTLGITQPAGTQPLTGAAQASSSFPASIPEPSTFLLMGLGLLGLAGIRCKGLRGRR